MQATKKKWYVDFELEFETSEEADKVTDVVFTQLKDDDSLADFILEQLTHFGFDVTNLTVDISTITEDT